MGEMGQEKIKIHTQFQLEKMTGKRTSGDLGLDEEIHTV